MKADSRGNAQPGYAASNRSGLVVKHVVSPASMTGDHAGGLDQTVSRAFLIQRQTGEPV